MCLHQHKNFQNSWISSPLFTLKKKKTTGKHHGCKNKGWTMVIKVKVKTVICLHQDENRIATVFNTIILFIIYNIQNIVVY